LGYEIVWDRKKMPKRLHPAVDLVDGKLIFGLMLPVSGESITDALCFVTDEGEVFIATDEELEKRNLQLKYPAVALELRWPLESIKEYVKIKATGTQPPFDPRSLLEDIVELLKKYIDLKEDEREYTFVALWIVGTYLLPVWNSYPYLSISGAKRSGKSKLLKFLEMLAFNALFSTNISTASLYRLVQSLRCTLLVDEAELLSSPEKRTELRNILNSGYKKYGYVFRTVKVRGDVIVPAKFEVFSPKAFVTYEGLEDVTEDRSVNIVMRRTLDRSIANSEIYEDDPVWEEIRGKLYVFALFYWKKIKEIYENLPEIDMLESRFRELWKPILALAKFFGDDVYEQMAGLAVKKTKERIVEDAVEAREASLIRVLLELVTEDGWYKVSEITEKLREYEEDGKWVTSRWVGRTLSRKFGFKDVRRGPGRGRPTERYITVEKLHELAKEYGVDIPEETVQTVQTVHEGPELTDEGYLLYIRDCLKRGFPEETVVWMLMENYSLSEEEARTKLREYKEKFGGTSDDSGGHEGSVEES